MESIYLHPLVAGAIGAAVSGAAGWFAKYHRDCMTAKDATIKEKEAKIAAAYETGKATEVDLEKKLEVKNRRIRELERRLSWFEARADDDAEPPEITKTSMDLG